MNRTLLSAILFVAAIVGLLVVSRQQGGHHGSSIQDAHAAAIPEGPGPDLSDDSCLADAMGARYEVSQQKAGQAESPNRSMTLWRSGALVAHEDPQQGITELWNQVPNGRLRLVRAFDRHDRSVSYEPVDLNAGKGERDWSVKFQLISDDLLKATTVVEEQGAGCERVQHLKASTGDGTLEVEWMPARRLMTRYLHRSPRGATTWKLVARIDDKDQVHKAVTRRLGYQDTDYADIGDNESDPFLLKMINLGFIEHGSSGMYDTEGHDIGGEHDHHGH